MGGGGIDSPRTRWDIAGSARDGHFEASNSGWCGGIEKEAGPLAGNAPADSAKGWWPQEGIAQDPELLRDLEKLLEPVTRGDPQSPLRWTCRSLRNLADELRTQGNAASDMPVAELLHEQKYSLQ